MDDQKNSSAPPSENEKTGRTVRSRTRIETTDNGGGEQPATIIRRRRNVEGREPTITNVSTLLGAGMMMPQPVQPTPRDDTQAGTGEQERPSGTRRSAYRAQDDGAAPAYRARPRAGEGQGNDERRPQRRVIAHSQGYERPARVSEHAQERVTDRVQDRGVSRFQDRGMDRFQDTGMGRAQERGQDHVTDPQQRVSRDGRRRAVGTSRKPPDGVLFCSPPESIAPSIYEAAREMARGRVSAQRQEHGPAARPAAETTVRPPQPPFQGRTDRQPVYGQPAPEKSAHARAYPAQTRVPSAQARPLEEAAGVSPLPQPPVTSRQADSVRPADEDAPVRRVLVCWLGKIDVSASIHNDTVNPGPIRMLLENAAPYDRILLLTSQNQGLVDAFLPWLAPCMTPRHVEVCHTQVRDMTDHAAVCAAIVEAVDHALQVWNLPQDGSGLVFHLSPGTPATHASMLLLAATRYPGVRLAQTKLPGIGHQPLAVNVTIPAIALQPHDGSNGIPEKTMRLFTDGTLFDSVEPGGEQPAEGVPLQQGDRASEESYAGRYGRGMRFGRRRLGAPGAQGQGGAEAAYMADDAEPGTEPAALKAVKDKIAGVANLTLPILLLGEAGCGKTRLARFIHDQSGRGGKFMSVDCAGLSDVMLASSLFGQRPGDYPGSWRTRDGAFRLANNGTIFLENVDALSMTQQTMLLRVLAPAGETSVQLPPYGTHPATTVHVRVVASAGDSIVDAIRLGRFRSDLYYRLSGVSVHIPSVREFTEDERTRLLEEFLVRHERRFGVRWEFEDDAWRLLVNDPWPGNLREMSRMLQQVGLLSRPGRRITKDEVIHQLTEARSSNLDEFVRNADNARRERREEIRAELDAALAAQRDVLPSGGRSLDQQMADLRRKLIATALQRAGDDLDEAAQALGVSRDELARSLRDMVRDYFTDNPDSGSSEASHALGLSEKLIEAYR